MLTWAWMLQKGEKEIYNVNLGLDVAKNVRLGYEYMVGGDDYVAEVSKDGWIARLDYKGAGEEAGSFGIHAQWFDQPINAFLAPTTDATQFTNNVINGEYGAGYEGYNIGIDYTLAKNIQLCVNWYDTESKVGKLEDEVIYTELYFNF